MIARTIRTGWVLLVLCALVTLAIPAGVAAWHPLSVVGECNDNGILWTATASQSESNNNVDFSYDADFAVVLDTFLLQGQPLHTSYQGGDESTIYVRWAGDHAVLTTGYAKCATPSPSPSPSPTPTPSATPSPSPSPSPTPSASPSPSPTPTATPTPDPCVEGQCPTPSATPSPTPSASPSPVITPPTTSTNPPPPSDPITFGALVGWFALFMVGCGIIGFALIRLDAERKTRR